MNNMKKINLSEFTSEIENLRFSSLEGEKKAFSLLKLYEEQLDGYLMWLLAEAYNYGEGTIQDSKKAIIVYKKAILLSSPEAATSLAYIYWQTNSAAKKEKALSLYELAVKDYEPNALHNLAVIYSEGDMKKQNLEKAFEMFLSAAEQDHIDSMLKVGWIYLNGEGVNEDKKKAKYWLEKALENGCSEAEKYLIYCN